MADNTMNIELALEVIRDVIMLQVIDGLAKEVVIRQLKIKVKGKGKEEESMLLETGYTENLPSPNYKTRHFSRKVTETLPDDISKEDIVAKAERQQKLCETLVKNDIARHVEELQNNPN